MPAGPGGQMSERPSERRREAERQRGAERTHGPLSTIAQEVGRGRWGIALVKTGPIIFCPGAGPKDSTLT